MVSFEYTIHWALGLHARPAGQMVKALRGSPCAVTVTCGERRADGKKLFALMSMAVRCGETVSVAVEGPGEETVCAELRAFFEEND